MVSGIMNPSHARNPTKAPSIVLLTFVPAMINARTENSTNDNMNRKRYRLLMPRERISATSVSPMWLASIHFLPNRAGAYQIELMAKEMIEDISIGQNDMICM